MTASRVPTSRHRPSRLSQRLESMMTVVVEASEANRESLLFAQWHLERKGELAGQPGTQAYTR
jgi:hypothetical protein